MALNCERIAGRQRGAIYSKLGFELLKNENRKYAALCLTCNVVLKNTAAKRLTTHRNVCTPNKRARLSGTTESAVVDDKNFVTAKEESLATCSLYSYGNNATIKTEPLDDFSLGLDEDLSEEDSKLKNNTFQAINVPKVIKNKMCSSYTDNITTEEEENINKALGEFFIGCNIPFSVVESDNFKKFIEIIRPAYVGKLPSKQILSTTVLDMIHKNCLTTAKKMIGPETTLLIDGWNSASNMPKTVVGLLYSSTGERAFLNSWSVRGGSHASTQLATIVMESQQLALSRFNTTIIAVVSEDVSNTMEVERITSLWHLTCNLYIANLFITDILKAYDNVVQSANVLSNSFKHSDLETLVIQKGGHSIKTPNNLHWFTVRDSLLSLDLNLQYMKEIASDESCAEKLKPEIKFLLFDEKFVNDIKRAIEILNPICDLILKYQNTKCTLADVVQCWISLKTSPVSQHLPEQFLKRKEQTMTFYALSAFLLDPTYDQNHLEHDEKTIAIEFIIKNLTGQGITEFDLYMKRGGFFSILFQKNIKDAMVFWNMAMYKYHELSQFARKLLQIPASSADMERLFPSWSCVHSSNRDFLGFEKSNKLLGAYYRLKMNDSARTGEY